MLERVGELLRAAEAERLLRRREPAPPGSLAEAMEQFRAGLFWLYVAACIDAKTLAPEPMRVRLAIRFLAWLQDRLDP